MLFRLVTLLLSSNGLGLELRSITSHLAGVPRIICRTRAANVGWACLGVGLIHLGGVKLSCATDLPLCD